eukprot:gene45411-biopygen31340
MSVEEYARRHRPEIADAELRRIHLAGFDKVTFLWAGGTDPNSGRYYRVMGPTFLIEYDRVQNEANHVHSIWRDAANDFGEDLLKLHYATAGHHRKPPPLPCPAGNRNRSVRITISLGLTETTHRRTCRRPDAHHG